MSGGTVEPTALLASMEPELSEPKPSLLFGGTPVSLHTIDQIGMIELTHGEPASGG